MRWVLLILTGLLCLPAPAYGEEIRRYEPISEALVNPLQGNVAWAEDLFEAPQPFSMVYANITWAELEPKEGSYDFEAVETRYHFDHWRELGKHMILRFVMDMPGKKDHCDLPEWLKKRVRGAAYKTPYGRGWCPDYEDRVLMEAHRRVIAALGVRYDSDPFVSFVELGSVGHWGEWHVHEKAGTMPGSEARRQYIRDYVDAFPKTLLMMRRPFDAAAELGLGLFNDASGDIRETLQWLDWIENGGDYEGETGGLSAMHEAWKTAPIGGELTTAVDPETLLREDDGLLEKLFRLSHTSWIGPNSFTQVEDDALQEALDRLMANVGSRLWVSESRVSDQRFVLTLENDGVAPFYYAWPVRLRTADSIGNVKIFDVDVDLRSVLPGEQLTVAVPLNGMEDWTTIEIGVIDPMTGRSALHLAMDVPVQAGWHVLAER